MRFMVYQQGSGLSVSMVATWFLPTLLLSPNIQFRFPTYLYSVLSQAKASSLFINQ